MVICFCLRFSITVFQVSDLFAALRLRTRPAPWQVEPKVVAIAFFVPCRTYEAVPILPGMSTGCPIPQLESLSNALVAPLRCTYTSLRASPTECLSSLAILCATSYTRVAVAPNFCSTTFRTQKDIICLFVHA